MALLVHSAGRCASLENTCTVRVGVIYLYVLKNDEMDTKLTLKLDKYVIDSAKEYASSHKKSLSKMIEAYLKSLIDKDNAQSNSEIEISPFVKSLKTGVKVPTDYDYKKVHGDHLMDKYK